MTNAVPTIAYSVYALYSGTTAEGREWRDKKPDESEPADMRIINIPCRESSRR
jgi:hypothetical protein